MERVGVIFSGMWSVLVLYLVVCGVICRSIWSVLVLYIVVCGAY